MPYFRSSTSPRPSKPGERDARRHGRVRTDSVACSLGEVVDISASGLRVRCQGKPQCRIGQRTSITIDGSEGPFQVFARPVWIRKTGMWRHEVGVCFEDLDEAARLQLSDLARAAVTTPPRD